MTRKKQVIVAIDVDGTLRSADDECEIIPDEVVRDMLIYFWTLGCYIVVWSGSGKDYAERIGRACAVDRYVSLYASKTEARAIGADITIDDEEVTLGTVNIRIPEDS
jgi:hypothetical protein